MKKAGRLDRLFIVRNQLLCQGSIGLGRWLGAIGRWRVGHRRGTLGGGRFSRNISSLCCGRAVDRRFAHWRRRLLGRYIRRGRRRLSFLIASRNGKRQKSGGKQGMLHGRYSSCEWFGTNGKDHEKKSGTTTLIQAASACQAYHEPCKCASYLEIRYQSLHYAGSS
jgi:hypothetical protein